MVTTIEPTLDMANDFDTQPEPELRELTKADRCMTRNCSAQAFVIAFKRIVKDDESKTGEIMFCMHHAKYHVVNGKSNVQALDDAGWVVIDCSDQLNEKPSVSANAD